jgi:putative two-component system hydrogenase maturation factor HypX/HoxX
VGAEEAARLTDACLPVSPVSALRCGLVDQVFEGGADRFRAQVIAHAERLARSPRYPQLVAAKARQLAAATAARPLTAYRQAELAAMSRNFFDPREPYARLRRAFVYKHKPARTPPHLADRRAWAARPVASAAHAPRGTAA